MAFIYSEPSHTFGEYLLVPGYSSSKCIPANVSLRTPVVKFKKGEESSIYMNIPLVSAIMQSVSDDKMAVALAKEGGISFIYGSQSIEDEAAMVARVKSYKAGYVKSDSNLAPDMTLADVLELKAKTGHSTMPVTSDGTEHGKLLGIVTSRDYRVSRMATDTKVSTFMTPFEKLITAPASTTLKEANDIIWEHKLNSLPIVDDNGVLMYFVFRKDYEQHKENKNELLDSKKRYIVGAGINTRDYAERVPALVNAGADVLCIVFAAVMPSVPGIIISISTASMLYSSDSSKISIASLPFHAFMTLAPSFVRRNSVISIFSLLSSASSIVSPSSEISPTVTLLLSVHSHELSVSNGRLTVKQVPMFLRLTQSILPFIFSVSLLAIARPSPVP